MRMLSVAALAMIALVCASDWAQAQYYRGGFGRGLGPSCGYLHCYVQHRYAFQPYRYAPPMRNYQWYGGPPRSYLGGRGGGWGGEW